MKIRHLYSFSANVYAFPSLHSFIFVRNYFIFALFDNAKTFVVLATNINQQTTVRLQQLSKNKPPFDCNNNQNSHTLFRLKLNFKQYRPGMQQYKSKSNFINPALTTINSAIINPP